MAVNFAVPFGPTARPGYMVTSLNFFDDFIGSSFSTTEGAATWFHNGGSGSTVVMSSEDEPTGTATLTPNESGLDAAIELSGEPIQFNRSADAIYEARWKVSAVATANVFMGFAQTGVSVASGSAGGIETNAIGFVTQGDANLDVVTCNGTTETLEDSTSDIVADTYVVTTWKWHARSQTLRFYVNGVKKITQSVADGDTIPANATNMTLVCLVEGVGGTPDLDVDYVLFAMDRP